MSIEQYLFEGVYVIDHEPKRDDRGFFMRTYDNTTFQAKGLPCHWVQENHAKSIHAGILRGLHFQLPPYAETKLVRCLSGMILDVFVDIRKGSKSFGRWGSIELCGDTYRSILIPKGFAHGYLTLSQESEVLYKVDNYYNPTFEKGIIWNDIDLAITWPCQNPVVSVKDGNNMKLSEYCELLEHIRV